MMSTKTFLYNGGKKKVQPAAVMIFAVLLEAES